MEKLFDVNWQSMFVPTESLVEIFVRGTIMYLGMFAILRIFRRQAGAVGIADLLVIVVIADAAQNGMAGDSKSITEAVLLILTIVLWNYFLDYLGDKFDFFNRILQAQAVMLVKDGNLLRANMKQEMISYDELMSQFRQQGIETVAEVKQCCLESNGHFSIIKKDKSGDDQIGNANNQSSAH